jgi:GNAT superfamily N-acetyltransferase
MEIGVASSDRHFRQILALQRRYHARALSREAQAREGFVTAVYTVPLLRRMAAELPQAIAVDDGRVVAYCLALPPAMRATLPRLGPMFDQLARCTYGGRPLGALRHFVGGQICVDRPHRGRGLTARLYHHVRASLPAAYAVCVTQIAERNQVSLRAHAKVGFETICTYSEGGEDWAVVAWALSPA